VTAATARLARLLVVGGSGFLGGRIVRAARASGIDVSATYHACRPADADGAWHRVDIRGADAIRAVAAATRPDVIINAAYRQSDWSTTADGGMNVALAAAGAGARLVHVSSDIVFSGARPRYDESCQPDPVTPYGAAKAAAETAVNGVAGNAVIARTSLIIGDGESSYERLVQALARGADGALYTDQVRCPVHVADLAAALLELASSARTGVSHVAGSDAVTRYELGLLIAKRDGLDATALAGAPAPATRHPAPLDVRLDSTRAREYLRTRLRGAREFLAPPA